jgi:hypothetical protein
MEALGDRFLKAEKKRLVHARLPVEKLRYKKDGQRQSRIALDETMPLRLDRLASAARQPRDELCLDLAVGL